MPLGSRVRANNVFGLVTDNPLTASATALNSNGLANLPAVSSTTQHAIITLDPLRVNGAPEIIVVTVHINLATVATITRGAFGTTARSHPQGTLWTHTPMNEDYISILTSTTRPTDPYLGEIIYETDTGVYSGWNGTGWGNVGGTSAGVVTLAYAEVTSIQAGITTETDITGLSVNVTVPTGRRIKISWMGTVRASVAGDVSQIAIKEDNTSIQRIKIYNGVAGATNQESGYAEVIRTPTAGTHNYKITLLRDTGTGTHDHIATASSPAYILVEDITGSATPFATQNVPVGQLGYSQVSADQAGITTATDLIGLSVNIVVPAGRVIKITGKINFDRTVNDGDTRLSILESATTLALSDGLVRSASNDRTGLFVSGVVSPSVGSHTYKLSLSQTGTGSSAMRAGATDPAWLLVEDITPTPTASTNAPNSTLAYAEVTTNQGSITAEVDLTGLAVTVTIPSGRRIRITTHVTLTNTGSNQNIVSIKEGATFLVQSALVAGAAATAESQDFAAVISPSAGTHTYKVTCQASAGTASTAVNTNNPAYILVEDITGAVWPTGSQVTSGIIASEVWTTWAPVITQGVNVTYTVNRATYYKVGRQVTFWAELVIASAGTNANVILISGLPFSAAGSAVFMLVGTGSVFDASAGDDLTGILTFNASTTSMRILSSRVNGSLGVVSVAGGLAIGDTVRVSGTYEAVS